MQENTLKLGSFILNSVDEKIVSSFGLFFDRENYYSYQEDESNQLKEFEIKIESILSNDKHPLHIEFDNYMYKFLKMAFLDLYYHLGSLESILQTDITSKLADYFYQKYPDFFENESNKQSMPDRNNFVIKRFINPWRNNKLEDEYTEILEKAIMKCQSKILKSLLQRINNKNKLQTNDDIRTYQDIHKYALSSLTKSYLISIHQLQQIFYDTDKLSEEDKVYLSENIPNFKDYFIQNESELDSSIDSENDSDESSKEQEQWNFFHQAFQAIVDEYPQNIAIYEEENKYTYREIHNKSHDLAVWLLSLDFPQEAIIGLFFEPSAAYVISLIAVMKAGFTFVPLDPYQGVGLERLINITNLCMPSIILSHQKLETHDFYQYCRTIYKKNFITIEQLDDKFTLSNKFMLQELVSYSLDQRAYIVFSSGTTGVPKGIEITHRGIMPVVQSHIDLLKVTSEDCVAQYAHIGFDMSLMEIFLPLSIGASLNIIPLSERLQYSHLPHLFENDKVGAKTSIAILTPTVLRQLSGNKHKFKHLRVILSAGEKGDIELFNKWRTRGNNLPPRMIINGYGPAECTIGCLMGIIPPEENAMPIGNPMYGIEIYFLELAQDNASILSPLREVQTKNIVPYEKLDPDKLYELAIGGAGVGRGYFKNSELTKKRFIEIIDSSSQQIVRIFRTFDAVRIVKSAAITKNTLKYLPKKSLVIPTPIPQVKSELSSRVTAWINHWYEGDEIDKLLKHSLGSNPEVDILTGMNLSQRSGDTFFENLQAALQEDAFKFSKREYLPQFIVIPVNLGKFRGNTGDVVGTHWASLVLYFPERENRLNPVVFYCDPFGVPMPEGLLTILSTVYTELKNISEASVQVSAEKLQDDGHSCGAWTVEIINYIVNHRAIPKEGFINLINAKKNHFFIVFPEFAEQEIPDSQVKSSEISENDMPQELDKKSFNFQLIVDKRLDRSIKAYGEMIYPEDIEQYLQKYLEAEGCKIEQVLVDAAITQKGHPEITAYIVSKENYQFDFSVLFHQVSKNLTRTHAPRRWIVVPHVQANKHGKLDMDQLRKDYPATDLTSYIQVQDSCFESSLENKAIQEVSLKLEVIWREVLELDSQFKFKMGDQFEYLGGTSMRLVQLHNAIRDKIKVNLPFEELQKASSYGDVIRLIREKKNNLSIVPKELSIQNQPNGKPVFLIHTLFGDAEKDYSTTKFVARLKLQLRNKGLHRTIYGISAPAYTHDPFDMPTDLKKLAKLYIKAIKKIQTEGPYLLIGWSAGGLIAFEMARQLEKEGFPVSVFMIDTSHPGYRQNMDAKQFAAHLIETKNQLLPELAGILGVSTDEKTLNAITADILEKFSKQEQMTVLFGELIRASESIYKNKSITLDSPTSYPFYQQYLFSIYNLFKAMIEYKINQKPVYANLYIAENTLQKRGVRLGWTDEFYNEELIKNADHFSIMRDKTLQNKLIGSIVEHLMEVESILYLNLEGILDRLAAKYLHLKMSDTEGKEISIPENYIEINLLHEKSKTNLSIAAKTGEYLFSQGTKKICLIGENGSGKTTLCKLIANHWSSLKKGESQFTMVLYISLFRYSDKVLKNKPKAEVIGYILKDIIGISLKHIDLNELLNKIAPHVLLIFDGYHEIVEEKFSKIKEIVEDSINQNNYYVLLTSTMNAAPLQDFNQEQKPHVKIMRIQPWNMSQKFRYIQRFFPEQPSIMSAINKLIKISPTWLNFIDTPLLLSILAKTIEIEENIENNIFDGPVSLLSLLTLLEKKYWWRYLKNQETKFRKKELKIEYNSEQELLLKTSRKLCQIEFHFIQKLSEKLLLENDSLKFDELADSSESLFESSSNSTETNPFAAVIRAGFLIPGTTEKREYIFFNPLMRDYFYANSWVNKLIYGTSSEKEEALQIFEDHCFNYKFITVWSIVAGLLSQQNKLEILVNFFKRIGINKENIQAIGYYQYKLWIECLRECRTTIDNNIKQCIIQKIGNLLYSHLMSLYNTYYPQSSNSIIIDLHKNTYLLNEPVIIDVLQRALSQNFGRIPPFLQIIELIEVMPVVDKKILFQLLNILTTQNHNIIKNMMLWAKDHQEIVLECVLQPIIHIIIRYEQKYQECNQFLNKIRQYQDHFSIQNILFIFPWIPENLPEEIIQKLATKVVDILKFKENFSEKSDLIVRYYQKLYTEKSFSVESPQDSADYLKAITEIENPTSIEACQTAKKVILKTFPIESHQSVKSFFNELEKNQLEVKPNSSRHKRCFKILKMRHKSKIAEGDIDFINYKILDTKLNQEKILPKHNLYINLLRGINFSGFVEKLKIKHLSADNINILLLHTNCTMTQCLTLWIEKGYDFDKLIPLALRLLYQNNIMMTIENNNIMIHENGNNPFCQPIKKYKHQSAQDLQQFYQDLSGAYENTLFQQQKFTPEDEKKFKARLEVKKYEYKQEILSIEELIKKEKNDAKLRQLEKEKGDKVFEEELKKFERLTNNQTSLEATKLLAEDNEQTESSRFSM